MESCFSTDRNEREGEGVWGVGVGHQGADGEEGRRRRESKGVEGCYVVRGWLREPLCL